MISKVVIRNLLKRPFLNMVKIFGLSLALTGIVFIALFMKNEYSYDHYHRHSDRIYRITVTNPASLEGRHFAWIFDSRYLDEFIDDVPEIEELVRLAPIAGGVMKYQERYYNFTQAFECDSNFFSVFDAELTVGDKQRVFSTPASMIVSQSFAERVFGSNDPIGETLTVPAGQYYGEPITYTVKGIMKNFPANSHFHPEVLSSASGPFNWKSWNYLLLAENADPSIITDAFLENRAKVLDVSREELKWNVFLQKLSDIHLHSHKLREIEPNGNVTNIYVLLIAALVLLLISIGNYANLNIGMAAYSAKYLFVNKLMGGSKQSIISYFLLEGLVIVTSSLFMALIISIPTNEFINRFYGLKLMQGHWFEIILLVLVFSSVALVFGLLPVLKPVLSSLRAKTNTPGITLKSGSLSKGILISQYAFSIALIVGVMVISRQTNYALSQTMGVEQDSLVCFESVHANVQQKFSVFKEELLKYSSIESVSAMMEPPGGEANDMFPFEMEDYVSKSEDPNEERIGVFPCDYSFTEIFNLHFLAGESFSENNKDNEGSGEYIINKAAMHRLNYTNPEEIVGKSFKLNFMYSGVSIPKGKIIGVVDDFHLSSIKSQVEPLVMFKRDKLWLLNFVVAYKSGMKEQAITDMECVWTKMFPEYPFQQENIGSMYQKVYKSELLQAKLLSIFTIIALFICSMGLLGLALITTQRRTKEIGIRKVNGATISGILLMLNKDFIKWVAIAFVIAVPIAYYAMSKWLENFAYKTELSWWIFALAGVLALGIALLTVSWQSWRAARRNPIESLRYE